MESLVVVADTYPPKKDGVLTYLRSILPLLKEDYSITLIAPRFSEERETLMEGMDVILTPCIPIEVANYYPALPTVKLARCIRRADIVLVNDLAPLGSAGLSLAHLLRKPVALFCHHDESIMLSRAFRLETRRLVPKVRFANFVDRVVTRHYKYADVIFVATQRFYKKLKRLKIPEEKIIYAPFAVDTEMFSPGYDEHFREKLGIPKDAKVVLYLGRMSHEKNVETIIRSIPEVFSRLENVYYVFAGGGPRLDDYERLAKEMAKEGVIFTDWVEWETTPYLYSVGDVFVFPSFHETQAFVIMEAMASSLPVVVPREPRSEYSYFEENKNCIFLEDSRDPEELADKVVLLLKNDGMREKLGRNARIKMESYSWREHVEKLKEGFERAKTARASRKRRYRLRGIRRRGA
jgi:glycosyltransferase involved in cell wall biosynthesis